MKSIIKLMLANIKRGKGSFSGIILLMALITFTFSGTVSNDDQLRLALTRSLDKAGVGELTVFIYDDLLTEDMLESLDRNANVESYTRSSSLNLTQKPVVAGSEQDIVLQFKSIFDGARILDSDCEGFTENAGPEPGEICLPYKMKAMEEMKEGNELCFTTADGSQEKFVIKGFYEDPVCGATTMAENRCMISAEDFERLSSRHTDHLDSDVQCLILQDELYIHGAEGVSPPSSSVSS